MNKEELIEIKRKLSELHDSLYLAYQTRDLRSRDKNIREAKEEIINYAKSLPDDLRVIFDHEIGPNALYGQHTNDITDCIRIVDRLAKNNSKTI